MLPTEKSLTAARQGGAVAEALLEDYEDLYEHAPDMLFSVDAETTAIIRCNQTLADVTGYSKAEILGRSVFELYEADSAAVAREAFQTWRQNGQVRQHAGLRVKRKDGSAIDVSLKATSVRDARGKVLSSRSCWHDISEVLRLQASLEESEIRFRTMADSAPVGLWMSGLDAKCMFFNQRWLRFTGRTLDQEIGDGWAEGVHPLDLQRCLDTYLSAFHAHREFRMEYRLRRADGQYRWILDHGVPRYSPGRLFAGYIGSCVDITERKEAEERLQASLGEKEVLLREAHHRVKNNLQIISSLLELESGYARDLAHRKLFRDCQQRIRTMALIHEQLYQSRDLGRIDMSGYLESLVAMLFDSQRAESAAIRFELHSDPVFFGIDTAIPVGLITHELVSNSLKHGFAGRVEGVVGVGLREEPAGVFTLAVGDNGIGLAVADPMAAPRSLGLQLVAALAGQIRAQVVCDSHEGTVFKVVFRDAKAGQASGTEDARCRVTFRE